MTTKHNLIIFGDGGSRNNPGEAACGFVVYENEKEIYKQGKRIGIASNNVAEYTAVIEALRWVKDNRENIARVDFFLDFMFPMGIDTDDFFNHFKKPNEK